MEENKEIRKFTSKIEIRKTEDGKNICSGCAVVFDKPSQNMGWIESIARGAITDEVIKESDIYALFNHQYNQVLARSRYGEGSLKLDLKDDGLYYSFEIPDTEKGKELKSHLERGELEGSSFAFTLDYSGDGKCENWEYDEETGTEYRTILKIKRLYDVSPVFEPAYLDTKVSLSERSKKDYEDFHKKRISLEEKENEIKNL